MTTRQRQTFAVLASFFVLYRSVCSGQWSSEIKTLYYFGNTINFSIFFAIKLYKLKRISNLVFRFFYSRWSDKALHERFSQIRLKKDFEFVQEIVHFKNTGHSFFLVWDMWSTWITQHWFLTSRLCFVHQVRRRRRS